MKRGAGILLPITSLPGEYVVGDFGKQGRYFVDFLVDTNHRYWQILPLNPTDAGCGNSPYSSVSAFALNPIFLSPDGLLQDGLIQAADISPALLAVSDRVDYDRAYQWKEHLAGVAFQRFKAAPNAELRAQFESFIASESSWLPDYARYRAAKNANGGKAWMDWTLDPSPDEIECIKFGQFLLQRQWTALKAYANSRGIRIIGDLPLFVNTDSADVWSNPTIFRLDAERKPTVLSGVPPDYFSAEGQLWGTPLFDWDRLRATGFRWWIARLRRNFELFDLVRIDHFRGLVAFWEIPCEAKTAKEGKWVPAPVYELFAQIRADLPQAELIAEDLGEIDEPVRAALEQLELPGMKILQFAFDEFIANNPYIPHRHPNRAIVYTGTHDNNTTRGWFERDIKPSELDRLETYAGHKITPDSIHWHLIRMALGSVADIAIVPMQDYLGSGSEGRMNVPGTPSGNWVWRLRWDQVGPELARKMGRLNWIFGRAN